MKNLVVVGQGYVGLPLAQGAVSAGMNVVGLELNPAIVKNLNAGMSHVDDISNSDLQTMVDAGYRASTDAAVIRDADVVVICVPTPLGEAGSPDLKAVISATESIAANLSPGTLVVLESTTYPGTTEELCQPILERHGAHIDNDFYLAFSPERIDPGNETYGLKNTPKVVGGVTPESTEVAVAFYNKFVDTVVPVKGAKEAETAKLLENTYRHINIALVNEMSKFCHELDIDLWDVISAAKTKPFGFQAFYPGPGVGGHCIPIDPNYLSYQVRRSLGYPFRFVELAEEINNSMPRYVADRIQALLNDVSRPLRGASVLLLGVTYKANIADERESPAVDVAEVLVSRGAILSFHDPKVNTWTAAGATYASVEDVDDAVAGADVVVLLQNHSAYDVNSLSDKSSIFFDTRGATSTSSANRL
ncbi:nucleotide sugar dehydrogenase [Pseudarthrobacter raffinosi]|uniref:nucleotide sugar dehydrogenase n=1 Tax=Pseudarthrobacter raffinosi TaxID=2953651 RepID=UPI00208F8590|nr:nucleotide sugar dehydrogenase [Pseudarthrobacter sp. MDT3-28]MCO4238653.1 nucleotide sugar dehydrogenase [Pseudarthrobacter sp. MDT3-28]